MIVQTDNAALAPCPLCKAQPRRNGRFRAGGVICTGDGMTVGMIHRFQTYGADQDEADAAWNRAALAAIPPEQDGYAEGRIAGLATDEAVLDGMDRVNRIAEAMMDDPFTDDERLSGTTQQMSRCQHYATIAIRTIANGGTAA